MSASMPPPPLTPQRIHEVMQRYPAAARHIRGLARRGTAVFSGFPRIPDFAAGETATDAFAATLRPLLGDDADVQRDYYRIDELLSILTRGTLGQEIARTETRLVTTPGGDFGLRVRLRHLRSIQPDEMQAVLDSLEALEGEFARHVYTVRRRHRPEQLREALLAAAASRTGDPRRPPLTEERVRQMLVLIPRLMALAPARFRDKLGDYMRPDELGADARKLLGARLSKAADAEAGGAEAFVRDYFWLLFIGQHSGGGRSIDSWLAEFRVSADPRSGFGSDPPTSRKGKNIVARSADAAAEMVRLLSLVGHDEEAAVIACRPEYDRVLDEIYQRTRET